MPDNHLTVSAVRNSRTAENACNTLQDSELKTLATLRLISFRMNQGNSLSSDEETEIATLIRQCTADMSVGREESFDSIEKSVMDLKQAIDAETGRATAIFKILDATRTVAQRDASCSDLENAANAVFEIANSDERFNPDWIYTKKLIEERGLHVEVKIIGNFSPMVFVSSPEVRKARKRTEKLQTQFVQSVQRLSKLTEAPPPHH
jgi:hypothetical protein